MPYYIDCDCIINQQFDITPYPNPILDDTYLRFNKSSRSSRTIIALEHSGNGSRSIRGFDKRIYQKAIHVAQKAVDTTCYRCDARADCDPQAEYCAETIPNLKTGVFAQEQDVYPQIKSSLRFEKNKS